MGELTTDSRRTCRSFWSLLTGCAAWLATGYFFSCCIAGVYFHSQCGDQSQIPGLLFSGELVSYAKGLIWPYYAFAAVKSPTVGAPAQQGQALDLNSTELSTYSRVTAKMMGEPLTERDLSEFKECLISYRKRTGAKLSRQDANSFYEACCLSCRYNYELGRCMLSSFDMKQVFVSDAFKLVSQEALRAGVLRKEKYEADIRSIHATANGQPYANQYGETLSPPRRENILQGFDALNTAKENLEKMKVVFQQVAD